MVVVEQSLTVAARLTDRVVFVEKGAVRFDGPPADLTADEELARSVFLGGPRRARRVFDRGDGVITLHGWDDQPADAAERHRAGAGVRRCSAPASCSCTAPAASSTSRSAAFGTTALAFMAVLLGGGVADWRPPFWVAFVIATVAAALAGSLAEWAVIRRLADAPRLVVLVATIGIAQVLLLVALLLPDVIEGGFFPPLLDWTWTASPELLRAGSRTGACSSSSPCWCCCWGRSSPAPAWG